jgi:hypothetical protein
VKFDQYDPNFAPTSSVSLANMIYNQAPFAGLTVQAILNEGNKVLAGCGGIYSASQLRTAIQLINQSWAGGIQGNSVLTCPAAPRPTASGNESNIAAMMNVMVFPNPNDGFFTLSFESATNDAYTMMMTDVTGRVVYNDKGLSTEGINHIDYNFSNLPKGVYLVQIKQAEEVKTLRVVIQ